MQVQAPTADAIRLDRGVTNGTSYLNINSVRTTPNSFIGGVNFEWNRNVVAGIKGKSGSDTTNKDDGEIVFETASAGTVTERMRILATGGLTFNGDTAAANALDDYEEGQFTPQFEATTTNPAYSASMAKGYYTKIGDQVYFTITLSLSSLTNTPVGTLLISGLPFTAVGQNLQRAAGCVGYAVNFGTTQGAPMGWLVGSNNTSITLYRRDSSNTYIASVSGLPSTALTSTSQIRMSGHYTTNA